MAAAMRTAMGGWAARGGNFPSQMTRREGGGLSRGGLRGVGGEGVEFSEQDDEAVGEGFLAAVFQGAVGGGGGHRRVGRGGRCGGDVVAGDGRGGGAGRGAGEDPPFDEVFLGGVERRDVG